MAESSVDSYLAALTHRRKAEIEKLRAVIRATEPALVEKVKWNAPSYAYRGQDRITFRLHPGERLELIFHRGAKEPPGAAFVDPTGLLRMLAPDRGVVTFADDAGMNSKTARLPDLIRRWLDAMA